MLVVKQRYLAIFTVLQSYNRDIAFLSPHLLVRLLDTLRQIIKSSSTIAMILTILSFLSRFGWLEQPDVLNEAFGIDGLGFDPA